MYNNLNNNHKIKLAKLYHDRWDIETYFRTIKYDISFKNFHSKKENL